MKNLSIFIMGAILLLSLASTGILIWRASVIERKLWTDIHDLQQSPDTCWKCLKDMEAEAAEQEAARINEVWNK